MLRFPLNPGERFDNFEIIKELGKGNYGSVCKVKDLNTNTMYALKILHQEVSSEEAKRQLAREAWVQGQLKHKNIVHCIGFKHDTRGAREKGCYLILEYVDGRSLQDIIDKNPYDPMKLEKAEEVIRSCLRALGHSHTLESGMISHGDIKPGNILVPNNSGKEVKISDWGIARRLGKQEILMKGSSSCAAPETLKSWEQGEENWPSNPLTDLFSLGIVAYYLLTGRHPFADVSVHGRKIPCLIKDKDYEIPPMTRFDGQEIPERLVETVMKLLQHHPRDRHQSAVAALDNIDFHDSRPAADMKINLSFPPKSSPISLNNEKCTYEFKDGKRRVKSGKIKVAKIYPSGIWQCTLPPEAKRLTDDYSIVLNLTEANGKTWRVGPFYPFVFTQEAVEV